MRTGLIVVAFGLLGCTQAGPSVVDEKPAVTPTAPESEPPAEPTEAPTEDPSEDPIAEPTAGAIAVQMTSATLADDCGTGPTTQPSPKKAKAKVERSLPMGKQSTGARAKRACEQSSIQLAIDAPDGIAAASVTVKSVTLSLASGTEVGALQARAPSVWAQDGGYVQWNEMVEAGQSLSVSYALTQPDWSSVPDRWNQTYTVKAVLSVAGADQTVQQTVEVDAPTSLPPNVKT